MTTCPRCKGSGVEPDLKGYACSACTGIGRTWATLSDLSIRELWSNRYNIPFAGRYHLEDLMAEIYRGLS